MEIESKERGDSGGLKFLTACYPRRLLEAVISVAEREGRRVYLVGGTVRDWLMVRTPGDLDITVTGGSHEFCRLLIEELGGGAFVPLGTEDEEAARVVWEGVDVDISSFRGGAATIEDDLVHRDFTVNSLAVELPSAISGSEEPAVLDPLSGLDDIRRGLISHCPMAFENDPLRLLRAFRFCATLGFAIAARTELAIRQTAWHISKSAPERVRYELDLIMESDRAFETFWAMHEAGLLKSLLPVLYQGQGVEQPGFHHLDVFHHNFQTLRELESVADDSSRWFGERAGEMTAYLAERHNLRCLKWAALLHDLGKPQTLDDSEKEAWRVTFYGHDERGRKLFDHLARRLRWSNEDRELTGNLIAMHMHPFHLCTVRAAGKLTKRAALKICRRAGQHLRGLFLLAMADSLASRGELKPEKMEQELRSLYGRIRTIYEDHIRPALSGPPLLGGRDLIEEFQLVPGPLFSIILDELQSLQVEGEVTSRQEALAWVETFLQEREGGLPEG